MPEPKHVSAARPQRLGVRSVLLLVEPSRALHAFLDTTVPLLALPVLLRTVQSAAVPRLVQNVLIIWYQMELEQTVSPALTVLMALLTVSSALVMATRVQNVMLISNQLQVVEQPASTALLHSRMTIVLHVIKLTEIVRHAIQGLIWMKRLLRNVEVVPKQLALLLLIVRSVP